MEQTKSEQYFLATECYSIKSVAGYIAKTYPWLKDEAESYVKVSSHILDVARGAGIRPSITKGRYHYFNGIDMYRIAKLLLEKIKAKKQMTKVETPTPIEALAVKEEAKPTTPIYGGERKTELANRLYMLRRMEAEIIEELLKGE